MQLKSGDQSLYNEFVHHYAEMGPKSFDHSKKFWFNKLRKLYLLVPEVVSKEKVATPALKQTSDLVDELVESSTATASKPAGFKPRFKAGITKIKPADDDSAANA